MSRFDTHLTFSPHISAVADRASSQIRLLKALAGTRWGQSKETLLLTYRSYIRPILSYAAPVWFPGASRTAIGKLQVVQNAALRVATGCLKMSPISHLHAETKVLPVSESLDLNCRQYLVSALRPSHPAHSAASEPVGAREIRSTLRSRYLASISGVLDGGVMREENYRATIGELHKSAVRQHILSAPVNNVLGTRPPEVGSSELSLPRAGRTTLAQLRSGHCSALLAYRHRVGQATSDLCPECLAVPHTVEHLFDCQSQPTDLSPLSLWDDPLAVFDHICTLPSFSYLLPPSRPPPEPPPT